MENSITNDISYRSRRFLDTDLEYWSLAKIGEYERTPLFEASLKALCLPLTEIRKLLLKERRSNPSFEAAWTDSERIYEKKMTINSDKLKGPKEYYLAIICYTQNYPEVISDFVTRCYSLNVDIFEDFPYKSLLFLLIQAELRMTQETNYDCDTKAGIRVYRALGPQISTTHLKARDLVAFRQLTSTTMDPKIVMENVQEEGGTIVEIERLNWSFRNIDFCSLYPMEQEVLIWPWTKFYVERKEILAFNIHKIVLRPTSQSFIDDIL